MLPDGYRFNFMTMIQIFRMKRRSHERKEQKLSRPEVNPLHKMHKSGVRIRPDHCGVLQFTIRD